MRAEQVIAVDLPGFGETLPDAVIDFLEARNLTGVDVVGNSMGARLALEPPRVALDEMRSFAASSSIDGLLDQLVNGPSQKGARPGSMRGPVTIGWGRQDQVCLPGQAEKATRRILASAGQGHPGSDPAPTREDQP